MAGREGESAEQYEEDGGPSAGHSRHQEEGGDSEPCGRPHPYQAPSQAQGHCHCLINLVSCLQINEACDRVSKELLHQPLHHLDTLFVNIPVAPKAPLSAFECNLYMTYLQCDLAI